MHRPDNLQTIRMLAVGLQAFAAGGCAYLLLRLWHRLRDMPRAAPWALMLWAVANLLLLLLMNTASRVQRILGNSPIVWQDFAGILIGLTCAGWVLYVAHVTRHLGKEE